MTRRGLLAAAPLTAALAAAQESGAKLRIVVCGGHPDDPETGCGGSMARFAAAGHEVSALYLTRGEAGIRGTAHDEAARIRSREAARACEILGASPLFAGQIDGAAEVTNRRYAEFREMLLGEKPDLVFTHWPVDTHRDHRACSLLTSDAWLRADGGFELYFYEVMTGDQTRNFHPTDYVDITAVEALKKQACYAHASQRPDGFWPIHDRMNRFRGMESGTRFAEAFVRYGRSPTGALSTAKG